MPHIIDEPYDHRRLANAVVPSLEFLWAYYSPIALGLPLTTELLALTPDPLIIDPPRQGELPDAFNKKKNVCIVNEKVRRAIEDLEPKVHSFISVNLQSSKNGESLGKAFLLSIGQTIDGVDRDRTTFMGGVGRAGFEKALFRLSVVRPC